MRRLITSCCTRGGQLGNSKIIMNADSLLMKRVLPAVCDCCVCACACACDKLCAVALIKAKLRPEELDVSLCSSIGIETDTEADADADEGNAARAKPEGVREKVGGVSRPTISGDPSADVVGLSLSLSLSRSLSICVSSGMADSETPAEE